MKPPVLAVPPDVNPALPSSIGRVALISGQAAVACGPGAPVGFLVVKWVACSIWMGRPEPRDANGLAGIIVGDGWSVGREPLIADVLSLATVCREARRVVDA
jgi:hypothetical protein